MLRKLFVLTALSFLLTACATGPNGYFQRSANNKIFDRKGFKGGKRAPLYNTKYVSQAKKNILNNDYEDDIEDDYYDDEEENISRENINMYKKMIHADFAREREHRPSYNHKRSRNKVAYPSIVEANDRVDPDAQASNAELKEEMAKIKSMLSEATKDLASYKCPSAKSIEQEETEKATKTESNTEKALERPGSVMIEPVKSI